MKQNTKPISLNELNVPSQFSYFKQLLCSSRYKKHLEMKLRFWSRASDRYLPTVFMDQSLNTLLSLSYEQMAQTPGVGKKKIQMLITLLNRAAETDLTDLAPFLSEEERSAVSTEKETFYLNKKMSLISGGASNETQETFERTDDFEEITEQDWIRWKKAVLERQLENELLGRLCHSLNDMTKVIQRRPLRDYCSLTLEELCGQKTYGEKRIRSILNVFRSVYLTSKALNGFSCLGVRFSPENIQKAEDWVIDQLGEDKLPTPEEIRVCFIEPLYRQVCLDAGKIVAEVCLHRLGLAPKTLSVQKLSQKYNVARARIYQLCNEIADIISIRWSRGKALVGFLQEKVARHLSLSGVASCLLPDPVLHQENVGFNSNFNDYLNDHSDKNLNRPFDSQRFEKVDRQEEHFIAEEKNPDESEYNLFFNAVQVFFPVSSGRRSSNTQELKMLSEQGKPSLFSSETYRKRKQFPPRTTSLSTPVAKTKVGSKKTAKKQNNPIFSAASTDFSDDFLQDIPTVFPTIFPLASSSTSSKISDSLFFSENGQDDFSGVSDYLPDSQPNDVHAVLRTDKDLMSDSFQIPVSVPMISPGNTRIHSQVTSMPALPDNKSRYEIPIIYSFKTGTLQDARFFLQNSAKETSSITSD